MLSGIVAASFSTASGAILGTSAVAVRNISGSAAVRRTRRPRPAAAAGPDRDDPGRRHRDLLRAGGAADRDPADAGLRPHAGRADRAVPARAVLVGAAPAAAAAAIVVGVVVRLVLFVLTPTMYGVPNDVLYIPNDVVGAGFDGWPTFIAPVCSLIAFVVVALLGSDRPAPEVQRSAAAPVPATEP